MSTSRGSGGVAGVQAIPVASRSVVQSLKEIVKDCPEAEIYATLKECNMDPNEAVSRLLSQDSFREVKSKREKKKEGKDTTESWSRTANNSSIRGSKSGADRYLGRGTSTPYNASESSPLHGKTTYKKEVGSTPYTSSFSSASVSRGPSGISDGTSDENKGSSLGTANDTPYVVQPYQSAWGGVTGHVSMADIVKMGRPQTKASHQSVQDASHHNPRLPEDQVPTNDEWPSIEKPAATKVIPVPEPEYSVDFDPYPEASGVPPDSNNQYSEEEDVRETEEYNIESSGAHDNISSRNIQENESRDASLFENDMYKNMGSYQHQAHDFERHEGEEVDASVPSVTKNLQQLRVENDDGESSSEGDVPSVVIPDHLQVQTADCSHLSFGSFGSGMSAPLTSLPVKANLEEAHSEADNSSLGHPEIRHTEYFVDDSHRNASSDGNVFHRTSSASRSEELRPENAEMAHGNQYPYPSSNTGYTFDDTPHLNAPFSQASSQMQNLAPFSNVLHSYSNSLPSTLLAANAHPSRESDHLQYSQFPASQSMSAKYGNSVSSIAASAMSMSEALKTAGFSSAQPPQQNLSGTNVGTGPPLPQHLSPYSQHNLPVGPYANMVGYPFMPQSYTYLPSAFQQAFAGNSTYHQSLAAAALLPQYNKNSVAVNSLPQSAAVPSGYDGFGGSTTTIPGNYQMNPTAAAATSGTSLSYEDLLSSQQYKELLALQQNENSAMYHHGHNSRTMPAVPGSNYYNYQAQNHQQPGVGFRQGQQQQQSQNYGATLSGYPNMYHSQSGISQLEQHQQQQNLRDGSQGQLKQSQIWPNNY